MVGLNDPPPAHPHPPSPTIVPTKIVTAVNGRLIVLPVHENSEYKSGRLSRCVRSFKMEQERLQDIKMYRKENTTINWVNHSL